MLRIATRRHNATLDDSGTFPYPRIRSVDEARQVEALAAQPHRHVEIIAGLATAWNDAGRTQAVIALVAAERAPTPELTWQLARAHAAAADAAHARPLLEAIIKAHGPHAGEATALLARLAP